jgi:hypothetical protein
MVKIPADIIAAAINFCSDEKPRAYLQGVFIHPEGYISATDSKIAFIARYDGERPEKGFLLKAADLAFMLKGKPAFLDLSPESSLTHGWRAVDAGYPETGIFRVFPESCSGEVAQFDVSLLARVRKAAIALHNGSGPATRHGKANGLFHLLHNGGGPAGVQFYGRSDCWACIGPCRAGSVDAWERPKC